MSKQVSFLKIFSSSESESEEDKVSKVKVQKKSLEVKQQSTINHKEKLERLQKTANQLIESLQADYKTNTISHINNHLTKLKTFSRQNKSYLDDLFNKSNVIELLIKLLIRFYKLKQPLASSKEVKVMLISLLADYSTYEKLRNYITTDENFEQIIKEFENEDNEDQWSKICRLAANILQDTINIKHFINNGESTTPFLTFKLSIFIFNF